MAKENIKKRSSIDVKFISTEPTVVNPTIIESDYDKYVKIGKDNKYPDQLLNYYKDVGLHRSIILKKLNMLTGKTVTYDSKSTHKKTDDFILSVNPNESLNTVLDKCGLDLLLFGGYYLQVIWEKGGKAIKEIYHMPYNRMRSGKADEFGIVKEYFYNPKSDGFLKYTTESDLISINSFSIKENKKDPQIMFVKEYDPGNFYYPFPDYSGAVTDINTLEEISAFHNTNIKNNFQPGFMIFFRGPEPDEDRKDAIVEGLVKKYSGAENSGKPAVFFLDTEQEDPVFKAADVSGIGEMYQNLMQSVKENIVVSHQIPRSVASIEQAGSLGNSKEILESNAVFKVDYIIPKQEKLLSGFNLIGTINKLKPLEIINPSPNILMFGLAELKDYLTTNEVRDYLGYEELAKEIEKTEE